jgi:hypothetical protein
VTVTHALARAAADAPELLDVDVDQLARRGALVAFGGLQARGGPSRSGSSSSGVRLGPGLRHHRASQEAG